MKKLKHIVSFVMVFALIFTSIPLTTFKAEAVDSAPSTDIVYGSNGNITRAEWLHDLAVVFDMSVESDAVPDNYFSDLESSHPYYNDIMLTVEFGVVDVEAGGNIFVDDLVSRDFAVTTLNFCLGYQASDEDTYTFSDSSECSSPTDALIAVEHGWVELIDNKFMPELPITSDEAKKMLDNAASVLDVSDIDANYDSKYVFQDDVIVVPENGSFINSKMTFKRKVSVYMNDNGSETLLSNEPETTEQCIEPFGGEEVFWHPNCRQIKGLCQIMLCFTPISVLNHAEWQLQ